MANSVPRRMPCAYIFHGGGPLPLLGRQPEVKSGLESMAASMPKPTAIVVVSAHYESSPVSVMTAERPGMYYDYGGFAAEAYRYEYDAPGHPELAARICNALEAADVEYHADAERDYDHGMFVPLMCMYPSADIPVVGMSMPAECDTLWKMGEALEPFRNEGVLVLGSGASFHNFTAFFRNPDDDFAKGKDRNRAEKWNTWLKETACSPDPSERRRRFVDWRQAPEAKFAHPTADHLTPLIVVSAAAGKDLGKVVQTSDMFDLPMVQFLYT